MLLIIATGVRCDTVGLKEDPETYKNFMNSLLDEEFRIGNSVFVERYALFDSRAVLTKRNRLFCYHVMKAVNAGKNIIIVVPDEMMVDRRLRNKATIIRIPIKEEEKVD